MPISSSPIRPVHSFCSAATTSRAYSSQTAPPQTALSGSSSTSPLNLTPKSPLEEGEIAPDSSEFRPLPKSESTTRIATLGGSILDPKRSRCRAADGEANPKLAPPVKRRREGHTDPSDRRYISKAGHSSLKSDSQNDNSSHSWRVADSSDYRDRNTAYSSCSSSREAEPSYLSASSCLPDSSQTSSYLSNNVRINQLICAAARQKSIRDIESICCRNERDLNSVNIATALHRIAQISKETRERPSGDLINRLGNRSLHLMREFKPKELSNIAWAFASLGLRCDSVLRALALAAVDKIEKFDSQAIANTAWAYATLDIRDSRLMGALALAAERQIHVFNPQELSNMAWAFATLGFCNDRLMQVLALAAVDQIGKFNPQNLANMAWAFATLGLRNDRLMQVLALAAEDQIGKFKSQDLSNTAWAFATLGICDNRLMRALALAAESQIHEFNPQNLSNTAWAFAMLENESSPLFRSIARVLTNHSYNNFRTIELQQLLQAQSALKLYGVDFSLMPSHWKLELPAQKHQTSELQQNVGNYLQSLAELRGEELKTESFIHEIDHRIDFTMGEIAFEVDGPTHFAVDSKRPLGSTLFRNRLLKQLGWKLVSIPYWEWDPLKTEEEKRSYLHRKIENVEIKPSSTALSTSR